ncbi:MAG: hypothetical protein JWO41_888, partial [Candidatus Saccharibacteria bacterium]|nr:hypothetical protein [Candidatus Saccharibacteria bacterium]
QVNGTYKLKVDNTGLIDTAGGLAVGATTVITSGRVLQNVTANASIITAGSLAATVGGTGQTAYTAGDLLYASNGTTLTKLGLGLSGQCLQAGASAPTWSGCASGSLFSIAGTSGSPQSVNGGGTVTIVAGNNISTTAGAGPNVTVDTVNNPNFTTSVTTPSLLATAALAISSGGTGGITISTPGSTSASTGAITIQSGSATVGSNLNAGTLSIDTGTTTGAGTATLNIGNTNALALNIGNASSALTFNSSAFKVTSAGAVSGLTTLSLSGAITGTTALSIAAGGTAQNLTLDGSTTGQVLIGGISTGDILLGGGSGSTGCTLTNSTGALACTSTINGATISGGTLSGGNVSGGTLTGTAVNSLNVSGTAITGSAALAIASGSTAQNISLDGSTTGQVLLGGTSTGDILLGGGSGSTGCTVTNSSGAFACSSTINGATLSGGTLSGGNVSGGTLTGTAVNSLSVSGTAITGSAALAIAAGGTAQNISLDGSTTGQVLIGGTSTGDILFGGGSGSTGCTLTNSTGALACTSTINGATISGGTLSGGSVSGGTLTATAVNGLTVSGTAVTGSGALAVAAGGTAQSLTLDGSTTGKVQIGATSTGDIELGGGSGSTGCTLTNSTGALACTSTINGATISGGTISGGNVSGGTLTASAVNSLNVSGTAISGTGALTLDGNGVNTVSIGSVSTGDILLGGGSGSTGCTVTNATGAFACSSTLNGATISGGTLSGGNVSGGTLTGTAVNSLSVSGTAISGTGALTVTAGSTAQNLSLDGSTTGQVLIGGTSTGDILLGGGSGSTGCTVTNSSGAFACASTLNGATISGGTLSGGSVSGSTLTGSALTFSAASTATIQPATSQALNITAHAASTFSSDAGALTLTSATAATWSTVAGNLTLQAAATLNLTGTAISLNTDTTVAAANDFTVTSGLTSLTGATSGDALNVSNSTSSGNIAVFKSNVTTVMTINSTGAVTNTNSTNSTAAWQVQNSSGVNLIQVDTASNNTNNLVTNASFEASFTSNWIAKGSSTVTQVSTPTPPYGANAAKVVTTVAAGGDGIKQNVTLTDSANYSISFYARLDSASASMATLAAGYNNGTSDTDCAISSGTLISTGWTKYICTVTTAASHSGTPFFYIRQTDTVVHTFYVDAVTLETDANASGNYREGKVYVNATVASPLVLQNTADSTNAFQIQNAGGSAVLTVDTTDTNLVGNSGFEVNTIGWAKKGSATISRDTGQAMYGQAALKVASTAASNDGAQYSLGSNLTVGATYTLSFSAKLSSVAFVAGTMVAGYVNGGGDNNCVLAPGVTASIPTTTGWVRFTCTFTVASTAGTAVYISQTSALAHTYWIDSVELDSGATQVAYGLGTINFNGVIASPLTLQNKSDSTSAFVVKNAASTTYLIDADTLNGRVGIGNSAPTATLDVTGIVNASTRYSVAGSASLTRSCGAGQYQDTMVVTGGIAVSSSGCTTPVSDVRLKQNIVSLDDSILDKIKNVRTASFDFDCSLEVFTEANPNRISCPQGPQSGVIAQELMQIFPGLVFKEPTDDYYRVHYDQLSIYTLKAVTEIAQHLNSAGDANFGAVTVSDLTAGLTMSDTVATNYPMAEQVSAGDVVYLDTNGNVRASTAPFQHGLLGTVVNTANGQVAVATAGKVSTKVSGPVTVGDLLTSSGVAGVAQVASGSGPIIGMATTAYSGSGQGTVIMAVQNSQTGGGSGSSQALQDQVNTLGSSVDQIKAGLTGADGQPVDFNNLKIGALHINLDTIAEGGLTVGGPAEFKGNALFDQLVTFGAPVDFNDEVHFNGNANFNNNTGGYAVINAGRTAVHVAFTKAYAQAPIVSLTAGDSSGAVYHYSNVTANGFDIVLDHAYVTDVHISWLALSVMGANTFIQQ